MIIPLEVLSVFFLASIALGLAPGPDNIFVLTQSAVSGRLAGLVVTLGLCTGLLVHTMAVALGVAALFKASPAAFTTLKLIGAAYLIYLAWMAFRAGASRLDGEGREQASLWPLYRRGIIMNVTNPKVAIFFLAFLPQFADPSRGPLTAQIIVLGGVFILATLLVFGGIAWFSGLMGEFLRRSKRAQVALNRLAGVVFAGLAVRLILSSA